MGTTADKGEYLDTTKSLLKDKINNLGGEITDETTFREYTNQLQEVYDRLPKTEYQEGTNITLENCLKGKLDFDEDNGKKVVGIGQSEQYSTKGYQLFDINGNRTDTNCTSSVVGNELHQNNLTNYCRTAWKIEGLVVGTSYILTLKYSNPNACSVQARIMDSSNNTVLEQTQARTLASGDFQLTFTAETTTHYIRFYSNTLNSTNTNEVTFYEIMLESGTTAHDWEKYTGGQASPNPNYEQEIEYVRGKNLYNPVNALENCLVNASAQIGEVTQCTTIWFKCNQNTTYTLSRDKGDRLVVAGGNTQPALYTQLTMIDDVGVSEATTYTFNSGNFQYIAIYISRYTSTKPTQIQIEEGSQATPYLPFNTIEEVVGGKNLLSSEFEQGAISSSGENSSSTTRIRSINYINVKPNTAYTISASESVSSFVFAYQEDNTFIETIDTSWKNLPYTFTTPNNCKKIRIVIRIDNSTTITPSDVTNIQLEENSTATTYEPYITPTSCQLSLGDIELNAIGNYKDYIYKNEGKWYKHSAIKKVTFNENTPNLTLQSINSHNIANFLISYLETNVLSATKVSSALSNLFSIQDTSIANTTEEGFLPSYLASQSMIAVYIRIKSTTASTTTEFRNWLQNHNISYYFALYNETDTEITDTTLINQLEAWYNAHSNNGTIIITSNGNLPMVIKVRGLKGE